MDQKGKYKYKQLTISRHYDEEMCNVVIKTVFNKATVLIWPQKDMGKFEELKTLIHQSVFRDKAARLEILPEVDDVVLAPYTKRNQKPIYYRGQVVSIEVEDGGSGLIRVRFVDHLREVNVKLDQLRLPTPEIMNHPIYGILLKIEDMEATKITDGEKELLTERMAQLEITDIVENVFSGRLWVGPEQTWNDLALDRPTNSWPSSSSMAGSSSSRAGPLSSRAGPSFSSRASPSFSSRAGPSSSKGHRINTNDETTTSLLPFKLRSGQRLSENLKDGAQVQIHFVWNVARLTIVATKDIENALKLDLLIDQYISDERNVLYIVEVPKEGDIVLAPYSVDNAYYRGQVTSVTLTENQGPIAKVFFIDYGSEEDKYVHDLRATTPEIMVVRDYRDKKHPVYGATMGLVGLPWNPPERLSDKMKPFSKDGIFTLEVVDGNPEFDDLKGQLWFTSEKGKRVNWTDTVFDVVISEREGMRKKGRTVC